MASPTDANRRSASGTRRAGMPLRSGVAIAHLAAARPPRAAMPSSRPVKPRCSVVVALTETHARSQSEIQWQMFARMAPTCGAIFGACAITVASTLPISQPAREREAEDVAQQRAAVGALPARIGIGKMPADDRPARARRGSRRRSHAAARRRRNARRVPRSCGMVTPPRISGRPATSAWTSKPLPMRMFMRVSPLACCAARIAAASARSSGNVTLMFAGLPRTSRGARPSASTACASSVHASAPGCANARASTAYRNICGVCACHSPARSAVASTRGASASPSLRFSVSATGIASRPPDGVVLEMRDEPPQRIARARRAAPRRGRAPSRPRRRRRAARAGHCATVSPRASVRRSAAA